MLVGIDTEGRVDRTRTEEEPKTGRGLGRRKREVEDQTEKQIRRNRGNDKGNEEYWNRESK